MRQRQAEAADGKRMMQTHKASRTRAEAKSAAALQESAAALRRDLASLRAGTNLKAFVFILDRVLRRIEGAITVSDVEMVSAKLGEDIGAAFDEGMTQLWRAHDAPDAMAHPNSTVPWAGLLGLNSVTHAVSKGLSLTSSSDQDIQKAIRYAVWGTTARPAWYLELTAARPALACHALRAWIMQEVQWHTSPSTWARTLDLLLRSPEPLKRQLIAEAFQQAQQHWLPSDRLREQVFDAALELGIADRAMSRAWIAGHLEASHERVPVDAKERWLSKWLVVDFDAAWEWVSSHDEIIHTQEADVARCVANALVARERGASVPFLVPASAEALAAIYAFLSPHEARPIESADTDFQELDPIEASRPALLEAFTSIQGESASSALKWLKSFATSDLEADWIQSFVIRHAVNARSDAPPMNARDLQALGAPHCSDPLTADALHHQVMARLFEVRDSVENGPFSDRGLMQPGMPEETLQLWLASRLNDTPQRKFSTRFAVYREPQVDRSRRTDIEVSARGFKVCIELKPLDSGRYSFAELLDTLRRQLVAQYLNGGSNSRHGILVLLLLKHRHWSIPEVSTRATFSELQQHLAMEANKLLRAHSWARSLDVVGITCCTQTS